MAHWPAMDTRLSIEWDHWQAGRRLLAGVDEAGRGPLAGPVVAAAVVLPDQPERLRALDGLTDSKALSAKARAQFCRRIPEVARGYGVGIVAAPLIDRLNILQATFLAMRRALAALEATSGLTVDGVIVDGNRPISGWRRPQWPVVKGDSRSLSIAAASVLAKELRDALMVALDVAYPGYGFARHKGYPTAAHTRALELLGPCPQHRRSFAGIGARQGVLDLWPNCP